jgi:hypothetical protein
VLVGLRTPASFARGAGRDGEPYYPVRTDGRGEKAAPGILAEGVEGGERVAGAVDNARAILESIYRSAPPKELRALLERVFAGEGIYLYVH